MADVEGKKLTELRVIDLKTELERRGLDKTGNKAALLERLSKAILEEGGNPEECLIVPSGGVCKISPRKNSVTGGLNHDESMEQSESQKEETTEGGENVEAKTKPEATSASNNEDDNTSKKEEPQPEPEKNTPHEEDAKQQVKQPTSQSTNESAQTPEKKTETEKVTAAAQSSAAHITVEANGIDNEDSINLTIGEDEENLLAEETESQDRHKDGGDKKKMDESKKGESKGSSGRVESGAGNKEGTTASGGNAGTKSKQDGGGGEGGKSSESSNKGPKRDDKADKKTSQSSPANASSRNLWVSGLSSTTRATDLKQTFSKYGKVIGAKVVTNAKTPGARCYGYVTMSTSEDAAECMQHLHRTELHGRVISVEKAKGDTQQSHTRKRENANGKPEKKDEKEKSKDNHEVNDKKDKESKKDGEDKGSESAKKSDEKGETLENKKADNAEKKDDAKEADNRSTKSTSKKPDSERGRREDKRIRNWDQHRSRTRSRSRERRRRDDVLTFAKIREEREKQRLRERERMLREEERRRREDMERQREVERRQREEAARLEREREKLRRERERIEQEKAELLRLERERQKLEREKLERERLELKRQQMRLEESRRAPPPPSIKRSSSDRRDPRDLYGEPERKRLTTDHGRRGTGHSPDRVPDRRADVMDRVSDRRMDPSPPSRYESSRSSQDMGMKKEFKRSGDFTSRSSRPDSFSEVSRGREVIVRREPLSTSSSTIDPRQVKERYDRPSTTTYTREREVRRSEPETHRSSRDSHTRYSDSFKPPGSSTPRESRYVESNRTTSVWPSGPPSSKSFNSVPSSGTRDPRNEQSSWSSRSSDNVNRWSNSSSMGSTLRHPVPPTYQSGPIQSMGLSAPGTAPSYDRFDPYKSSIPSMRKY